VQLSGDQEREGRRNSEEEGGTNECNERRAQLHTDLTFWSVRHLAAITSGGFARARSIPRRLVSSMTLKDDGSLLFRSSAL